jgi:protease IV
MKKFRNARAPGRRGGFALVAGALLAGGVACHRPLDPALDAGRDDEGAEAVRDPSAPKIADFDLSRGAPEVRRGGLLRASDGATFFELLTALRQVEKEPQVRGVFVRFGGARLGWSRAAELADLLGGLRRAGRTVTCHADEWNNVTYWAASRACEKIWLSPAGGVETAGLSAELVFARELLAKLGVGVDILQVGRFKGANETFTRDAPSDEVRESLGGFLRDMRAAWAKGVAEGRGKPEAAEAAEDGPHPPEQARALGLVDEVGYVDEALRALRKQLGAGRVEGRFGGGASGGGRSGLVELVRVLSGAKRGVGAGEQVAVVRAVGAIALEGGGGLLGDDVGVSARGLGRLLRKLGADDDVKAVVLRIDSPGGSALGSDLLWHDLMALRKKKPLVVSVGDMAASGGYYMACAGTKVVAEESSLLGSIGVVGGKLSVGPALEPYGVHVETLTPQPAASGSAAPRGAYGSFLTPWDEATRGKVLASMTSVYDLFVKRVAEGRALPVERVQAFAEGRVFAGREAKERGMVDELGGLVSAIALARVEAKLPADAPARLVGDEPGLLDVLGLDDDEAHVAAGAGLGGLGARLAGLPAEAEDVAPFVRSLTPMVRPERALVAMPFALLIR